MTASGTGRRLLVGLAVVALLAGCASGPPTVVVTTSIAYESANPLLVPGVLDVHAPAKAGPWS
jgi:uncharacterized lipoprotein YajG